MAVLIVVPLVTAFIGYFTNWAAIKMIFHPEEFVGVWKIGWQGVLPQRSEKFARDVADMATSEILSARELAGRFDPVETQEVFADILDEYTYELVWEATEIVQPLIWEEWGPEGQRLVLDLVKEESQSIAREIFEEFEGISDEVLDLHGLVIAMLTGENLDRLTRLFKQMGRKEFRFIEIYGGFFGLVVGLTQVAFFGIFGKWWVMPLVGAVVGLATNWLAIQMIFRPQEPVQVGPFRYQGMFPKRQYEIADDYGRIAAEEILTPRNLFRLITEGEGGERIARMVLDRVQEQIEAQRGTLEVLTQTEITPAQIDEIQAMLVQRVQEAGPDIEPRIEEYVGRKLGVAGLVSGKLKALSKEEFEQMLRGLLEEDEWILVALGGALGLVIGLLQAAFVVAIDL
jgi:uncharacterized membrane protein YheB (UPF0754 family)